MDRLSTTKQRLHKKLFASLKNKYREEYKKENVTIFADEMAKLHFADGSKRANLEKILESHNKETQLILFQKLHPDDYISEFESYVHQSMNLIDFFSENDQFNGHNYELFDAKERHRKSCIIGQPLLFCVFMFPKLDQKEISDMELMLIDDLDSVFI